MIRGLTSAARGMIQQVYKQDIIANNLANVATSGYKRRTATFNSFASALAQETGYSQFPRLSETPSEIVAPIGDPRIGARQDESQGGLQVTGSKLNLAIEGPGFFVTQSSAGQELTRNGSFRLNGKGEILTQSGATLMGQSGPIVVSGADWEIDSSGRVTSGGAVIDRLKIVSRDDSGKTSDIADGDIRIVPGALELSNVSAVREMVGMIANLRAYEASQKTIQAIDHTLDKLINEAGKV